MRTHTSTHTDVHINIHMHAHIHIHTSTHTGAHMNIHMHTHIHIHTHAHTQHMRLCIKHCGNRTGQEAKDVHTHSPSSSSAMTYSQLYRSSWRPKSCQWFNKVVETLFMLYSRCKLFKLSISQTLRTIHSFHTFLSALSYTRTHFDMHAHVKHAASAPWSKPNDIIVSSQMHFGSSACFPSAFFSLHTAFSV